MSLDNDFEVLGHAECGEISSSKEEMLDNGFDLTLDIIDSVR